MESDLHKIIVSKVAYGLERDSLYHYLPQLASQLNIPHSIHAFKSRNLPRSEWLVELVREWASVNGRPLSTLALLSAIVKIRGMGVAMQYVSTVTGTCRSQYSECLSNHLGRHWVQLALHWGVHRTKVDDIALKQRDSVSLQLKDFLTMMSLPDIGNGTMLLFLVALRAADLQGVERDLFTECQRQGFLDDEGRVIEDRHSPSENKSTTDVLSIDPSYQHVLSPVSQQGPFFTRADAVAENGVPTQPESSLDPSRLSTSGDQNALKLRSPSPGLPTPQKPAAIEDPQTALSSLEKKAEEEFVLALFSSDEAQMLATNKNKANALHLAAEHGYVRLTECLLAFYTANAKDYINAADRDGMTPLLAACEHDREDIAELLLKSGADTRAVDQLGRSCLHCTATARNDRLISLLCRHGADANSCVPSNETRIPPLTVAAMFGDLASVRVLVEFGADPNYPKHCLCPPILAAAQEGKPHVVELLLERRADPSAGNPHKYSALHVAAFRKHYDVVKCILDNDPSPDMLTEDNATSLMCAAASGSSEIIDLLLHSEAQVDAVRTVRARTGRIQVSPVAEAALSAHFMAVKTLVEGKAYLHHLSGGAHSVLEFACSGGDPDVVKIIVDNFEQDTDISEFESPFIRAIGDGNFLCAKVIVDKVTMEKLWEAATSSSPKQEQLARALCEYSDQVSRSGASTLPNTGLDVGKTVGTPDDIFLQLRYQHMSVQAQVDCIKYALLFKPLSVVKEERKLLVDVCWHLLQHIPDKDALYTKAVESGSNEVAQFLTDYCWKDELSEAEGSTFLCRMDSGDPTPVRFLCSSTTVDQLWDTAESSGKDSVAQFFQVTQTRSQETGRTASLNMKRVFHESIMKTLLDRLKQACREAPSGTSSSFSPYEDSRSANEWSLSVVDEDHLESASVQGINPEPLQLEQTPVLNNDEDRNGYTSSNHDQTFGTGKSCQGLDEGTSTLTESPKRQPPLACNGISGTQSVIQADHDDDDSPPLENYLAEFWQGEGKELRTQPIGTFSNYNRKLLVKVGSKLGTKWVILARFLGFGEDVITEIKSHSEQTEERSCQMLRRWVSDYPDSATWKMLCDGLVRMLRGDITDIVVQYITNSGNSKVLRHADQTVTADNSNLDILTMVSRRVSASWKALAKELRVAKHPRRSEAQRHMEDECLDVLLEWLQLASVPPVYQQLYSALENIGHGHVIAFIEDDLQKC